MPAIIFTPENLRTFKRALTRSYSGIISSHLSEAMAAALGFSTHAHLRSALGRAPAGPDAGFILLDETQFFARLSNLGWAAVDDGFGAFYGILPFDGTVLVNTEPQSSFEIEYKSQRQRLAQPHGLGGECGA